MGLFLPPKEEHKPSFYCLHWIKQTSDELSITVISLHIWSLETFSAGSPSLHPISHFKQMLKKKWATLKDNWAEAEEKKLIFVHMQMAILLCYMKVSQLIHMHAHIYLCQWSYIDLIKLLILHSTCILLVCSFTSQLTSVLCLFWSYFNNNCC